MAYPKPWLWYNRHSTYLEHIIQIYLQAGISEIVVVLNSRFCKNEWAEKLALVCTQAKVVENDQPDLGRLHSIRLGLSEIASDFTFIHNADSPYVGVELIETLARNAGDTGVFIPVVEQKKGHPVLISNEVKARIINDYQSFESLRDVLGLFKHKLLNTQYKGILENINTKKQFEEAESGHFQ